MRLLSPAVLFLFACLGGASSLARGESSVACSTLAGCTECTLAPMCGLCVGAGPYPNVCMAGNATGPATPTDCAAAAWITTAAQCSARPCSTPAPPANGLYGTCATASGWSPSGSSCSFACPASFTQLGDASLTCTDGSWNGTQLCSTVNPATFLTESDFHMDGTDWFLLIFLAVWSVSLLVLATLLLSGQVAPHFGAPPTNLLLWDASDEHSPVQKQQRCRRWMVAIVGTIVFALTIGALASDLYATGEYPSDRFQAEVDFGAFAYNVKLDVLDLDEKHDYPSCDSAADKTLCSLFKYSMWSTFLFGVLGAIASFLSLALILLVLGRWRREGYWRYAMRFNVCAFGSLFTSILLYAASGHTVLQQMFSRQLNFEFARSWYLMLGATLAAALWCCLTFLYYRPTAAMDDPLDDAESDGAQAGGRKPAVREEPFLAKVPAGSGYGAVIMREEDPFQ